MKTLPFALRMLRRDARAGELHLLVAALVIAVAAMTAVGFFTDRVRQGLDLEANQLLGADLLLTADHPWPPHVLESARQRGLSVAETRSFPSMVSLGEGEAAHVQLAGIKAVSEGYPLRGSLRVAQRLHAADAPAAGIPAPGTIWIDERLASSLRAGVGDFLAVGDLKLRVESILTQEPDRGINFFSVAPRLLMSLDDLESTGLVQPGSRVSYRILLAGEYKIINAFKNYIDKALERGERLEDAENSRPEIRAALDRSQRFLGLSALLTVVLAAVAVALASRRYMQRHLDPCAIMRCLGATQGMLLRVYLGQFVMLGALASALGCALGYFAHFALYGWLAQLLTSPLPPPGPLPALQGVLIGLLLLFGFSLPPLLQLRSVSTLRVLRREFFSGGLPPSRLVAGYAAGLASLAGLMFWMAGEIKLGFIVVGGFLGGTAIFAGMAWLAIRMTAHWRHNTSSGGRVGFGWRYGLASLHRHTAASIAQIVALSLGFMALLLLTVTRNDLFAAWQQALPHDAPNRFVVNIQPDQLDSVRRIFSDEKVSAEFSPMVRGRLQQLNGKEIGPADYADDRAKRLIDREFNLSWRADLPPGNSVIAGRWFNAGETGKPMASVEEGLAKTLKLKVGDRLEFVIAGEKLDLQIVGLRKLNWDSMRANFFVLTPPSVLEAYPANWMANFYLPPGKEDFVTRLVRDYPHLTVVDVAAIVRQVQTIMDQAARAMQFVFLFTLLAGVVVLYAALASAAGERRYELAVMRALGARSGQLERALLAEFAAIGALSGLIASLAALAVEQVLADRVFNLDVTPALWLPPAAMLVGALLVMAAGYCAATRLMQSTPLDALRSGV